MAEETTWDYKSDEGKENPKTSKRSVDWEASEYIDHKQGAGWFLTLAGGTLVLVGIVYLFTHDYFAVGTIIALGAIVGVIARRTPRDLHYKLDPEGLMIEEKFYPLNQFKSYSIIEEGAVCNLELMPLKRFMPPISIYFAISDEKKITAVLDDRLPYVEKQLDRIEQLSRRLRF